MKVLLTYLDSFGGWDVVSEVTSVEVTLETTNRDDEFGVLNSFPDLRSTDGADIDL